MKSGKYFIFSVSTIKLLKHFTTIYSGNSRMGMIIKDTTFAIITKPKAIFFIWLNMAQKMTFLLRISSLNMTKSAGISGYGHIY